MDWGIPSDASGSLLAAVRSEYLTEALAVAIGNGHHLEVIGKLTTADTGFEMIVENTRAPLPSFASDEYARLLANRSQAADSPLG